MDEQYTYLWSHIFDRKTSPSTSYNQVDRLYAIRPASNVLLDGDNIVRYDTSLGELPLVVTDRAENILQDRDAFVT